MYCSFLSRMSLKLSLQELQFLLPESDSIHWSWKVCPHMKWIVGKESAYWQLSHFFGLKFFALHFKSWTSCLSDLIFFIFSSTCISFFLITRSWTSSLLRRYFLITLNLRFGLLYKISSTSKGLRISSFFFSTFPFLSFLFYSSLMWSNALIKYVSHVGAGKSLK